MIVDRRMVQQGCTECRGRAWRAGAFSTAGRCPVVKPGLHRRSDLEGTDAVVCGQEIGDGGRLVGVGQQAASAEIPSLVLNEVDARNVGPSKPSIGFIVIFLSVNLIVLVICFSILQ